MRDEKQFVGKNILVLGLAKSGFAASQLLHRLGANVTVNDAKPLEENKEARELEKKGIRVICGAHPLSLLDEPIDVIVKNPGIPYTNPIIEKAVNKGIPIVTEIEIASLISEADMIGITGSNGKTTTTTLIVEMLKNSNRVPLVAGNIGTVACEVAEKATRENIIVAELSSFQLQGTVHFHPKVAVLLNLFDAHLDYHGTKQQYVDAKKRLFANLSEDDYFIYNADQDLVVHSVKDVTGKGIPFSKNRVVENGVYVDKDHIYFQGEEIIPIKNIALPGAHNLENILAAIAASKIMGAKNEQIVKVLQTFSGVKHRLQYVDTVEERKFYNDSKATNILASSTAVTAFQEPVILLAGGLDRGNSFEPFIDTLSRVKAVITFGETKEKIAAAAREAGVKLVDFAEKVEDAVPKAFEISSSGDVILLSPACASWDQYKTFEERGDRFIEAVNNLKK